MAAASLWRGEALLTGLVAAAALALAAGRAGRCATPRPAARAWRSRAGAAGRRGGRRPVARAGRASDPFARGAERWSDGAVAAALRSGKPAFVYFTADWCLSCKVNEAAAIEREGVAAAFRKAGVRVFVGDWTDGDPAITRFLESRGRAGVPLYLWYEPGKPPEELPQLLTPDMLASRALRQR